DKQTEGKVLGAFIMAAVEYERLADATAITHASDKASFSNTEKARKILSHNTVVINTPYGTYNAEGKTEFR
ncbi:MAG: hypothetical protein IIZ88_00485, partial [Prevotella sp.]|nr:hypothetical protein [Prevotella sp.]